MKLSEQFGINLLGPLEKRYPDRIYEAGTRWEGVPGASVPHSTITIRTFAIAIDWLSAYRDGVPLPPPASTEVFEMPCERHGRVCRSWREFLLADLEAPSSTNPPRS